MKNKTVGIVDFGAGSGKVFSLDFDGGKFNLTEHYRFENHPVSIRGNLYNDVLYLYDQSKSGLIKAVTDCGRLDSVGFDTWGNDYALLDGKGELLRTPYNYRDLRTIRYESSAIIPFEQHYAITGIPCVRTNTYFQLRAERNAEKARHFLMTPDLFAYFMTGNISAEYVVTSTSSLVRADTRTWAEDIIATLPFDRGIFPEIVPPGTDIGRISDADMQLTALRDTRFIKTASHDTGSAVIATPVGNNSIYLSCGSMSLIGIVLDGYLISRGTYRWKYHNQGLPDGKMRIQRSMPALWIMQQCRKYWRIENPTLSFADIEAQASMAEPFKCYIDVLDSDFSQPTNMPKRIQSFCQKSGQYVPQTVGEIARCLYESIAVKYRMTALELDAVSGQVHDEIYVIGGGIKDRFLMQMIADCTGKTVRIGFDEASAMGNGIMQLIALGELKSIEEAHEVIFNTLPCSVYYPKNTQVWADQMERVLELEKNTKR